jgi:hypothetical protein
MEMGMFACRMHLLINFEETSSKALTAFEESICSSGTNPHAFRDKAEPGSKRLARTCASAFTMRGSAVAGVHDVWDAFLQERGLNNKFLTYHGNRMNIGFRNCVAVCYHHSHVTSFLQTWPEKKPTAEERSL